MIITAGAETNQTQRTSFGGPLKNAAVGTTLIYAFSFGSQPLVIAGSANQAEILAGSGVIGESRTTATSSWVQPQEADRLRVLSEAIHADSIRVESLFKSLASGEPVDTSRIYVEALEAIESISTRSGLTRQIILESGTVPETLASVSLARMRERGVAMFAESISPAVERIREFSHLPQGWDGFGASQVAPTALGEAGSLLVSSVDTPVYSFGGQVDVALTPTGGVLVEWRSETRRLQVVIHEDGHYSGFSAQVQGGKTSSRTKLIEPDRAAALSVLAAWGDV